MGTGDAKSRPYEQDHRGFKGLFLLCVQPTSHKLRTEGPLTLLQLTKCHLSLETVQYKSSFRTEKLEGPPCTCTA